MLPLLKRMEGKHTWHVRDKSIWLSSYEEAQARGISIEPSLFPSPEKAQLPLHRCMRFLPHHQDTGGFFVAVLQKVSELPPNVEAPRGMAKGGKGAQAAENKAAADAARLNGTLGGGDGYLSKDAGEECAAAPLEPEPAAAAASGEGANVQGATTTDATGDDASAAQAEAGGAGNVGGAGNAAAGAEDANSAAAEAGDAAAGAGNAAASAGNAAADAGGAAADAGGAAADAGGAAADAGPASADAGAALAGASDAGNAAASAAAGAMPETRGPEEKGAAGPSAGEPSWVRGQGGRGRTSGGRHAGIDPIVPVESPEILQSLCDFYGISRDNPLLQHLLSRNLEKGRPKKLNVVTTSVMDLLKADVREQLKIIATGLKLFDRQELKDASSTCAYRIAQEGVSFLLPHITRQRVHLGLEDFLGLLCDRYISIIPPPPPNPHTDLPDTTPQEAKAGTAEMATGEQGKGDSTEGAGALGQPGKAEAEAAQGSAEGEKTQVARKFEPTPWNDGTMKGRNQQRKEETKDTALLAALNACMPGCVIAELKPEDAAKLGLASGQDQGASGALAVNAPLVLSAWKGKATLAIMADKAETAQMVDKIEAARSRMEGKSQT
ncbi:hypothetical protein DUNSADRAFT_10570 [Dunaliella salina]|nr:hypothetical protein DUNSADRAFT_10570 [Dunaliella salina]|eukprot:KAF5841865.1 hypothetical protein DUNSADRAFT_10570 [Dunaliella salina]